MGRHEEVEALWKEYFRDPSQWWDNRNIKLSPSCPDFKHKATRKALWFGLSSPPWVLEELRRRPAMLLADKALQQYKDKSGNVGTVLIHQTFQADDATFVGLLRASAKKKDLYGGIRVHADSLKSGLLEKSSYAADAVVSMYAKCGELSKAKQMLYELPHRNVVSWTALIAGCTQNGYNEEAVACYKRMQHEGISPNAVTFTCVLTACGSLGTSDMGKEIHDEVTRQGLLGENIVLGTALVHMYAKCGALVKAEQVLRELPVHNVVSWSALIAGYAQQGKGEEALKCFEEMQTKGLVPNLVTFMAVLKACGSIRAVVKGTQIHDELAKQGLLRSSIALGTAVMDMYCKCGALLKAKHVLEELPVRDTVAWNALITGYVQQGQSLDALNCFEWMRQDGVSPDAVTFTCILKACGSIRAPDWGEKIHDEITRQDLLKDSPVLGTALIDMYAKCGALAKAQHMLDELPVRDVATWNALITGYAQEEQGQDALNCLERMQREGLLPNVVTFTCILMACGSIGAIDKGEQIHDEITRQGLLQSNVALGNVLVSMYAKCGALDKAAQVVEELSIVDVVSWSALIAGYAREGRGKEALECFKLMQQNGLSPDAVTFSSVLSACSHSGLVDEGEHFFASMRTTFGIKPDIEHYMCMVNLYGHAGHLGKAVAAIKQMPSSDYSVIWSALLAACCKWSDVNVGRWAFNHAIQVDKSDAAPYICMAKLYASAGMQEDADMIEAMRVKIKVLRSRHSARNNKWEA